MTDRIDNAPAAEVSASAAPAGAEKGAAPAGPSAPADTAPDAADFEALIRGRYKEAFDARVRKILDGRLRGLRQENERLRRLSDGARDTAVAALDRLARDEGDIRAVYPGFRWQRELADPAFARLIGAGVDGRTAYEVVHREELLRRAMRYAAGRAVTQTARSIASGARPVAENGGRSAAVTRPDPRRLTPTELADIRRRVQNGEKIRF
ncbi:MAG: hypothetical protein E7426_05655 [Ruminococcaceae bacterium]|nr:hypothetical protein [Oscillospiraceae bacterium]